jgi:hypothetical protein
MEESTQVTPAQIEEQLRDLAPLNIIRTETVISKLPIHNLAKKGTITIKIARRNAKGETTLYWEVSPSRNYGDPRQLAYKLDTLIINRRFDEQGRPLPHILRLGSLRQIGAELGIPKNTESIKRALHQNAGAYITAKLTYDANDGTKKRLEAGFTRYSIVFTGEQLPDGRQADAVYLILTEPYREVLNNAPVRPLNYDYLRELRPAAQRFYEIVSRPMFGALKYQRAEGKLLYSEYCTYSAQQRYFDYDRFKKQMYKIHRPHLASGYLKAIRYAQSLDAQGAIDWIMYYTPGPKAKAEYQAFTRSGRVIETASEAVGEEVELATHQARRRNSGPRQQHLRFDAVPEKTAPGSTIDPVLDQMTRRGISARQAIALLAGANPEFILDQIEWGDHLIQAQPGQIKNPPGFYVHLIREKITPPESFETSRQRRAREEARAAKSLAEQRHLALEEAYRAYRAAEIDRHIASFIRTEDMDRLISEKTQERRKDQWSRNLPPETIREIAARDVRLAIAERIPMLTFDEFSAKQPRAGETPAPEIRTA